MQNKRITWILYGALALIAAVALFFYMLWGSSSSQGAQAIITVDGREVQRILLADAPDQEFSIYDETGVAITFEVRSNAIRFLHSDCPDKICVNSGFQKNDGDIATCLPNLTVLTIFAEDEPVE